MRVLVTGANGFVGWALVTRFLNDGVHTVRGAFRTRPGSVPQGLEVCVTSDFANAESWQAALEDVDAVVHCAARVHMMHDDASDPLEAFREINTRGTIRIAEIAAAQGCKRFVFLSSVKAVGEQSAPDTPLDEQTPPQPVDPYGLSKLEAEQGLLKLSIRTGMEVTIVRPPLVYGPGVKANFRSMMSWLQRGIPLPLGGIRGNRRSLVALDNLADFLVLCTTHSDAANETFFVSDQEDVSTTELLERLARAMGKRALLVPVPSSMIRLTTTLLGKSSVADRLCGSLVLDTSKASGKLGWHPVLDIDEGLRRTAGN